MRNDFFKHYSITSQLYALKSDGETCFDTKLIYNCNSRQEMEMQQLPQDYSEAYSPMLNPLL
jgi:uncharacterized membrane-anchored protein YhcB (DUF1043 family)